MWAHQVIEDLESFGSDADIFIREIKNSQKFNFGNDASSFHKFWDTSPMFSKVEDVIQKKVRLLNSELNIPYNNCWFDFQYGESGAKYGYLLTKRFDKPPLNPKKWSVEIFNFAKRPLKKRWRLGPYSIIYNDEFSFLSCSPHGLWEPDDLKNYSANGFPEHLEQGTFIDSLLCIYFIVILSCKNIITQQNTPPEALNKKRIKRGKLPLFSYKTLVLKPTTKQEKSIPKDLWDNRIHLCRGHFKEYTSANPLFGRITGRFWWQPSVRGRNKNGVVMKDYEVKTA
jgi:hypothetical protein